MYFKILCLFCGLIFLKEIVAPPVDQKKPNEESENATKFDDFGLEYGRYLQQVVQALEEDKEFAKKLENVTSEQIRNAHIAKELEFVKHNVRSKLDELKRIEIDRLRKVVQERMERVELGLYRDKDGHLLNSPDGRRWRTLPNRGFEGLDRKGVKIPKHVDIENPHSFEIEDLKKLILTATNDLEELDKRRREEFKQYELEKEASYRESLKNMTEEERKEIEKQHQEKAEKHKDHPKLHHPGSKPQLEQVWEERDHMPKQEFNEKTFFAMHDMNGDGHLDMEEVEALLIPEIKKMYDPNNGDDYAEMEEEFHRMREHIFNETDKNRDGLISLEEFIKMSQQPEFQRDEGWRGLDEQQVYSEAELQEYMRQRQMQMPHPGYGDDRMYYDVNAQYGVPPQPYPQGQQQYQQGHPQQYQQGHPQQGHPQQGHPQQGHPQQGHPQQGHPQQGHPQQGHPQQGHPQQGHPQQGHPQQYQQGHPQQYQQGHPQQFQQGHPQQFQQGHPQQQFQQGHPQQQFQQGHPQQQFQQAPQQQFQQAPQHQFQQGHPQQLQHAQPQQFQQASSKLPVGQQSHQQGSAPNQLNPSDAKQPSDSRNQPKDLHVSGSNDQAPALNPNIVNQNSNSINSQNQAPPASVKPQEASFVNHK